jgi:hypothetical protein
MNMRSLIFLLFLPLFAAAQIQRPIGTNLAGVVDYSTELVFTDAFKQCREWTTFNADDSGPWDTQVYVPMRADGYPLQVPIVSDAHVDQKVRALILWDIPNAIPLGKYRLIAEGKGEIRLDFGAKGTYISPVDTLVEVNGGVALQIAISDEKDPVHSIKFIYPEYVDTYKDKTFTDEFMDFIKDFQNLRFMDWQRTNNSDVVSWNEISKYDYYTQTLNSGVAYEYIVELSNLMKKDPWICIPHLADDEYIIQLAKYLNANLDPSLKLHLEYSNEVWNGGFQQHHEAADMAAQAGYTGQEWERAWKWTAKRSADIFRIFETEFGGHDRLYRIIPSQAANSWLSNQIITFFEDPTYNPTQVGADALAIAPYFGGEVPQEIVAEGSVSSITVEEIVARMKESLPVAFAWMDENKIVADAHNLELINYEGGQHTVGTGGNENIQELTDKLTAANRHPDLHEAYCEYFNYWYENFGGLFAHFSSHGNYSKWGSWGVKETLGDINNPKYLALKDCVFSFNDTPSSTNQNNNKTLWKVFPNPSQGIINISGKFTIPQINVLDRFGHEIPFTVQNNSNYLLTIKINQVGVFLIMINDASTSQIFQVVVIK